jgi:hypothetical protein
LIDRIAAERRPQICAERRERLGVAARGFRASGEDLRRPLVPPHRFVNDSNRATRYAHAAIIAITSDRS